MLILLTSDKPWDQFCLQSLLHKETLIFETHWGKHAKQLIFLALLIWTIWRNIYTRWCERKMGMKESRQMVVTVTIISQEDLRVSGWKPWGILGGENWKLEQAVGSGFSLSLSRLHASRRDCRCVWWCANRGPPFRTCAWSPAWGQLALVTRVLFRLPASTLASSGLSRVT